MSSIYEGKDGWPTKHFGINLNLCCDIYATTSIYKQFLNFRHKSFKNYDLKNDR